MVILLLFQKLYKIQNWIASPMTLQFFRFYNILCYHDLGKPVLYFSRSSSIFCVRQSLFFFFLLIVDGLYSALKSIGTAINFLYSHSLHSDFS